MMTSSNGNIFRVTGPLNKQSRRRWFETPSHHYDVILMCGYLRGAWKESGPNGVQNIVFCGISSFFDTGTSNFDGLSSIFNIISIRIFKCVSYLIRYAPLGLILDITWWRDQMETFSTLLALCAGNSPVTGDSPHKVTRSFDVFFDLRLNKRLSKQPRGWWFETPSRPLWRHCNESQKYVWVIL